MTDRGTFVVNGIERVVVSQLVRSAGVFFTPNFPRQAILRRENHSEPRRVAGNGDRSIERHLGEDRPQAQSAGHRALRAFGIGTERRIKKLI
jgi:DNA-directed RNA polymerase beta subunit